MEQRDLRALLAAVAAGQTDVDAALLQLKEAPFAEGPGFEDLGFAKLDHHRALRQGVGEVIYGAGKTPGQIAAIAKALHARGQKTVLITRMSPEAAQQVAQTVPLQYDAVGRTGIVGELPAPDGDGAIVVATGGTSDMPVAEEAARTAEAFGNRVTRLYDVGVAGLHRLLAHTD